MAIDSDEPSALQKLVESAYKPRDPIPYSIPPFQQASLEQYEQCISPRELLSRFPYSAETAIKQIRRELEYDRIQAIAHQGIWRLGDDVGSESNLLVGSWAWWLSMPALDSDFWDTGYLEVWVPRTIHEFRVELHGNVRLYGIRFWPQGDGLLVLESPSKTIEAAPKESRPAVSDADLRRWHDVFSVVHSQASEETAVRSAQAMFPDNHVARQRVRDLRGPQPIGKPAGRGK